MINLSCSSILVENQKIYHYGYALLPIINYFIFKNHIISVTTTELS